MKTPFKALMILILSTVLAAQAAFAEQQTAAFTTGKDWSEGRLSAQEKLIAVAAPMIMLDRYGVPFEKRPQQYVRDIDRVLMYNPYLEGEDIANIFASTVYAYEPASRPALDALERELHFRQDVRLSPRLVVRRDSSEL